jgi:nickel transport protein
LSAVYGHDYWFMTDGEDYWLHRGHRFSPHSGAAEVPFDPAIVTSARCLRQSDTQPVTLTIALEYPPRIEGPCIALLVSMDSGYWSQTVHGTRNQPKDSLSGVLRSWHSVENVKHIEAWHAGLRAPFSTQLELVLTEDPFVLEAGDKLRLIAMLGGKPKAGVSVAYDGNSRGVTGDDGKINIRIRHRGTQHISASLSEPLERPEADKRLHATHLMFDLD